VTQKGKHPEGHTPQHTQQRNNDNNNNTPAATATATATNARCWGPSDRQHHYRVPPTTTHTTNKKPWVSQPKGSKHPPGCMLCGHAPCYAVRKHSGFWLRGSVHTPRSLSGAGASKQLQSRCSTHSTVKYLPPTPADGHRVCAWELSQHTQHACRQPPHSAPAPQRPTGSKLRPGRGTRPGCVNQSQPAANTQRMHSAQPKGGRWGRITQGPQGAMGYQSRWAGVVGRQSI
jgi:hypothetical protein